MGLFFGTDGIRGIACEEISGSLAYKVGASLASMVKNAKILVGRDTRVSGQFLAVSFCAGAMSGGATVTDVGITPTPAVAFLTKSLNYDFGVVISASHNGKEFNGIKVFDKNGYKLSDKEEERVERGFIKTRIQSFDMLGKYENKKGLVKKYEDFLVSNGTDLTGLKIVLDGSNGALYSIAPSVFKRLNAQIVTIACKNDGMKINDGCGALNPQKMARTVLQQGAFMGFAFDGDGDRIIACTSEGRIIDGDIILYAMAKQLKKEGRLKKNTVVGTSHTNMAIEKKLNAEGITLIRADVGDKYVLAKLLEQGLTLGAEQSGHVILKDLTTTGDGILTAVVIASMLKAEREKTQSKTFDVKPYPQTNLNVEVSDKLRIMNNEEICSCIRKEQNKISETGRITVRASGTENKIRIMVESENKAVCDEVAQYIKSVIKEKDMEI